MKPTPPDNPAGRPAQVATFDEATKIRLIKDIRLAPNNLRTAVAELTDTQLDTLYKNWTMRQIVHHLADSHVHSYIRFKWALTEVNPMIKAYEEADWVQLADAHHGDISPALGMLEGTHAKWAQLLEVMTPEQYLRTFMHPQAKETVNLWSALHYYVWHSYHHTAQVLWLRDSRGWK